MAPMPAKMKAGTALGMIGGFISVVALASAWGGSVDDMPSVGLNMLAAVMFFAAAGTFTKYSPVRGNTVFVISLLAVLVVVIGAIFDATNPAISAVLAIIALVCALIGLCPKVESWVDKNRLA